MGVELELAELLTIAVVGMSVFSAFEGETAAWRKILKWSVLSIVTLAVYALVGHWALAIPLVVVVTGMLVHVIWCRRHGIDAVRATPRRRYYELRGWPWPDSAEESSAA